VIRYLQYLRKFEIENQGYDFIHDEWKSLTRRDMHERLSSVTLPRAAFPLKNPADPMITQSYLAFLCTLKSRDAAPSKRPRRGHAEESATDDDGAAAPAAAPDGGSGPAKPEELMAGASCYGNYRSAINWLYRTRYNNQHSQPADFDTEVKEFCMGVQRIHARDRNSQGKAHLPYSVFRLMCKTLLPLKELDARFLRTWVIWQFNLLSRSANLVSLKWACLEAGDDFIGVKYNWSKSDQAGLDDQIRHVYANPLLPEMCPFLALGLWALGHPDEVGEGLIFPGDDQKARFAKAARKYWAMDDIEQALEERALKPEDLGSHSLRKGAATFVAGGSTAAPGQFAICNRAQWIQPGHTGRYVKLEAAADQYVGRTVTGLPIMSQDFAVMPPKFCADNADVDTALVSFWPRAPVGFRALLRLVLASVVRHATYVKSIMSTKNPLGRHAVFTEHWLPKLNAALDAADTGQPTGVPPHVVIFGKIADLTKAVTEDRVQDKEATLVAIREMFERYTSPMGISQANMENVIAPLQERLLGEIAKLRAVLPAQPHDAGGSAAAPADGEPKSRENRFVWGGRWWKFKETFTLPEQSPCSQAFHEWFLDDGDRPRLRSLNNDDFPKGEKWNTMKRSFGKLKKLMESYEQALKDKEAFPVDEKGSYIDKPDAKQVGGMWNTVKDHYKRCTKGGRELCWITVFNKEEKKKRAERSA
jgi:hypothetical protein